MNAKDQIANLKAQLDEGSITQDEYETEKSRLLSELLQEDDAIYNPDSAQGESAAACDAAEDAPNESPAMAAVAVEGEKPPSKKRGKIAIISAVAAVVVVAAIAAFVVLVVNKPVSEDQLKSDITQLADKGSFIRNDYVDQTPYSVSSLDVLSVNDGNAECRARIENESFNADVKVSLTYTKDGFDWSYQDFRLEDMSAKAIAGVSKVDGITNGVSDFDEANQTCTYTYTQKNLPSNWLVKVEKAGESVTNFKFDTDRWVKGETTTGDATYSSNYIGKAASGKFGDVMGLNSTKDASVTITSATADDENSGDIEMVVTIQYSHQFDPKSGYTPTGEVSASDMHLYELGLTGRVSETKEESGTYKGHYYLDGDDFELTLADESTGEFLTRTITGSFKNKKLTLEIGSSYAAVVQF